MREGIFPLQRKEFPMESRIERERRFLMGGFQEGAGPLPSTPGEQDGKE